MGRICVRRPKVIEVVAGYLAQNFRKAGVDLGLLALIKLPQLADELLVTRRSARIAHRAKLPALTADGAGLDGEHVVNHVAVRDGARATGVVARHAADRRL